MTRTFRTVRMIFAGVFAATLALVTVSAAAVPASAAPGDDATISGTVTVAGAGAGSMGTVTAYNAAGEQVGIIDSVMPWDSGAYQITGLPAGTFYLLFERFTGAAWEWYDDASTLETATGISVAAHGSAVQNVQLSPEATIHGSVTIAGVSAPAAGEVRLYDAAGTYIQLAFPSDPGTGTSTYSFGRLRAGTYYVDFTGFYAWAGLDEWYGNAPDFGSATPIVVTAGSSADVSAELAAGPSMSGHVTAADTGDPLADVEVILRDSGEWLGFDTHLVTGSDGFYSFGTAGLPPFEYTLEFVQAGDFGSTTCPAPYACEFYGGGRSIDTASWFSSTAGGVMTGMDVALDLAGSISGTVTGSSDPTGLPATVQAWLLDDPSAIYSATADANGDYSMTGLPPGDYKVAFSDHCSYEPYTCETPGSYATAFWNSTSTSATAAAVSVAAGGTVTGIDANLVQGARISGRVVDAANPTVGLQEVRVFVQDLSRGSFNEFGYVAGGTSGGFRLWGPSAYTDENGYFETDAPLPVGDYKVLVAPISYDGGLSVDFAPQWWGGASFYEGASVLTITNADPVTLNAALSVGGSVSGNVTRDGLAPFEEWRYAQVVAQAYNADTAKWESVGEAITDPASGNYTIPGLAPGTYKVGFYDHVSNLGYLPAAWHSGTPTTFYHDQPTAEAGNGVSVAASTVTSGIDAVLRSTHVPVVAALGMLPASGFTAGGTSVAITGERLGGVTWVTFDGIGAPSLSVTSDTRLTVTTPPHAAGPVEVVLWNSEGPSAPVTFTYSPTGVILSDIAGGAFEADIQWMANLGISTGYADGTFHPAASVSRQAMAAFMYRFAGSPAFTAPGTSPFNDVPTSSPFYTEICWMADQAISTGYADGGFHPGANVSRQAMAAFMYRFAGRPAFTPPVTSPFTDVPTSSPFYTEIAWMLDATISTGYADGGFHPGANVSRQAMAAFMHRLDGVLAP